MPFGDLSPIPGPLQLRLARRNFGESVGGARAGDLISAGRLGGDASTLLQVARNQFASGPQFTQIFGAVEAQLRGVQVNLLREERELRENFAELLDTSREEVLLHRLTVQEMRTLVAEVRLLRDAIEASEQTQRDTVQAIATTTPTRHAA